MGALLSVAVLAGCEYADPELLPGSSSAVPQPFPSLTAISEDAAAQTELMAQVDAVMGEQAGIPSFGVAGGMRDGAGMSSFGSLTDAGTYPVRAACAEGQGALLTIRQRGEVLLTRRLDCGTAYNFDVQLRAGEVLVALEPIGGGLIGGAVRFEVPLEGTVTPDVRPN